MIILKIRKAWQSFLTGTLALVVVSGIISPAAAAHRTVISQPSTAIQQLATTKSPTLTSSKTPTLTSSKTAKVSTEKQVILKWKNLNRNIHRTGSAFGLTGEIVYTAPKGATGEVAVIVSHQRPSSKKWEEIGSVYLEGNHKNYTLGFSDWNQNLNSGSMKYRATVSVSRKGTKVKLPAGFTVDYNKKNTTVSKPKLAGKTLTTDSLKPFRVTGKVNGSETRIVGIQRYDSKRKRWYVVDESYAAPGKNFSLTLPSTKKIEKYRIFAHGNATHKTYYGKATWVKRTAPRASVAYISVQKRKVKPWATNKVELFVQTRRIHGETYPKVTLQEKVKGKWKNVKTVKGWGTVRMTLPKGNTRSKDAKKTYRFVVGSLSHANGVTTKSFTIKWDNPRR